MTTRETILQATRDLCQALATGTTLTDSQVIPSDDDGTRPQLPYLTCKVLSVASQGTTEKRDKWSTGTSLSRHHNGGFVASVSIQGYGAGSDEWLERIRLHLDDYAAEVIETASGVSFMYATDVQDLSAMLDTSIEPRFTMDLFVSFSNDSIESVPVASTVIVTTTGDIVTSQTLSV
jgi:hypothetical protein